MASGEQTLGVIRSKHHLARKAWQRQVIDKFGERFQQWEHAACRTVECGPGSISGYSRCTYAAYACAPDVNMHDVDELKRVRSEGPTPPEFYQRHEEERRSSRELGPDEISEMQRILRDMGYRVSIDGAFGEQTSEALIAWQRRAGVREDGEATIKNLELLRRGGRS
ncbi:MAG: peptidoglycan-binding domain-containing protein [Rhodomicrobium sp.]